MSTPKINDFVRFKNSKWDKIKSKLYVTDNTFQIMKKEGEHFELDMVNGPVLIKDMEPIPIDRKYAGNIYYDPIIAASFIGPGEAPPTRHTDYRYFMDSFEDSFYEDGRNMADIVKSRKYKYVHEVQQWLRRDFGWEELRIKHNYKREPEMYALKLWELKERFSNNGVPEHLFIYEICNILFVKFASIRNVVSFEFSWSELTKVDTPLPAYSDDISKCGQYACLNSNEVLNDVIKYVDGINLDLFGEIMEFLIDRAQSEKGSSFRQYSTNSTVMETIIKALRPQGGEHWDDPAAGIGGTFIAISKYQEGYSQKSDLSGCEINNTYAWIGLCNLLFHNIPCQLEHKDSFERQPQKYDGVVCDIPLGTIKINPPEYLPLKVGNRSLNFILEVCASMKDNTTSRAAFIIPDGFFSSSMDEYVSVKKYLFNYFTIEAILKLPEGLNGISISQSVVFIDHRKEPNPYIWVFDARNIESKGNKDNVLNSIMNKFVCEYLYYKEHRGIDKRNGHWMRINLSDVISNNYSYSVEDIKGNSSRNLEPIEYMREAVKLSKQLTNRLQELYSMFQEDGNSDN